VVTGFLGYGGLVLGGFGLRVSLQAVPLDTILFWAVGVCGVVFCFLFFFFFFLSSRWNFHRSSSGGWLNVEALAE